VKIGQPRRPVGVQVKKRRKENKKALLSQRWPRDAPYKLFTLILFTLIRPLYFARILILNELKLRIEILFISARVTFWPFKVIRGHWFWCQSKARMRLPISP